MHGRGEVTVPGKDVQARDNLALRQTNAANGYPFEPTGDPMVDGVGPASWAKRRDLPELDGHGHPKIVPMGQMDDYRVSAGRDPRGLTVITGDGAAAGTVTDMWVDAPEQLVRYLEVEVADGTARLVPIQMAKIKSDRVVVNSIFAEHFTKVPVTKSPNQVTLLEEDKISGFYGGGTLYASQERTDPLL